MTAVTVHSFLASFFPLEDEAIHLRAFKPREAPATSDNYTVKLPTTRNGLRHDPQIRDEVVRLNQNRGIYFVVNSGGDDDESITRFNAFFAESDTATIQEQHESLDRSPIQPSIRVQTKKSVHAYWLVDGDCSEDQWRDVQARLISHFGGDGKIKNPSRVMRLPYFYHLSLTESREVSRQRVEIVYFDGAARFSAGQMEGAFEATNNIQAEPERIFSSGVYMTWDALNSELRRRILAHPSTRIRGEWAHSRGVCHQGKGETALALNVATGAYSCQAGCKATQILESFGLPNKPQELIVGGRPIRMTDVSGMADDGEVKQEKGKGIYRVGDLREKLYALYEKGREPGLHPGWENLNQLYTIKRGQFTIVTGIPNVGKTPFLDNLTMNMAKNHKWKIAICSLENPALEDHLSTLLEIYTGEPFSDGKTPRMSKDAVERTLDWFDDHFVFLQPDESNMTVEGMLDLLDEVEADGVVADPWNEFEHRRPPMMTETEYTSMALSKMRRYIRARDQHLWLVVHPTKLIRDKEGNYPVPTLYDCAGSAHFRNKPEMGIVLWRDVLLEGSPLVVYVQKVKFRWCGKVGKCELHYNIVTGQFYDANEKNRNSNSRPSVSYYEPVRDEEF
jgi:hypothetical protein